MGDSGEKAFLQETEKIPPPQEKDRRLRSDPAGMIGRIPIPFLQGIPMTAPIPVKAEKVRIGEMVDLTFPAFGGPDVAGSARHSGVVF